MSIEPTDQSQQRNKDALLQRIRELESALHPFVRHYASWMDRHDDAAECTVHSRHTFGQLRTAVKLLQPVTHAADLAQPEASEK